MSGTDRKKNMNNVSGHGKFSDSIAGLFADTDKTGLLDSIFEQSGAANMIVDENTIFLRVNREFERLTGYSRREVEGRKSWTELVHPDDMEKMVANHKLRRENPEQVIPRYEYRFIAADGYTRWGFLTGGTLPDGKRSIISVVDITELKKKEEALQSSEARYSDIVQTQTELITRVTPDLKLTFVNDAFCKYYGERKEDLLGRSFTIHTLPEDLEKQRIYFASLKPENPSNEVEERAILPTGEIRWQHWSDTGIFDEMNRLVEIQSIGRDITERRQMEKALEESNSRFMRLFRESRAIMLLIDPDDGAIIEANDQATAFYGYDRRTLEGMNIKDINQLDPGQVQWAIDGAREKSRNHFVFPHRLADGSVRTVETYTGPVDFGGRTVLFSIIHDITKRQQMEKDLEETYSKLSRSFVKTVEMAGRIIEVRDPYTAGHQRRVAELGDRIAREMGLSEEVRDAIFYAGLVHDIGKIHVPSEILSKPGKLMESEFMLIRQHPLHSFEILEDLDLPWPIARISLRHHERLDGSGYPNGLSGSEIGIEARILAVADVVEAMASNRPYREALGVDAALDDIRRNRERLYDPAVVDACLDLFLNKGYVFSSTD
ncbi:MAG: PAS domain S-box protein [Thermovirgaceae bacterium]|nr:PAS domain S-box protein [Thermovirgaceae bacterium]